MRLILPDTNPRAQPSVIIRRPWTRPPQTAVTPNYALPYGSSIKTLWHGKFTGFNLAGDVASNLGTGISNVPGVYGIATQFSGSGTGRPTFTSTGSGEATFVVVADITAPADLDRLFSQYNGSGSPGQYDLFYATANGAFLFESRATVASNVKKLDGVSTFTGCLVISVVGNEDPIAYLNGNSVTLSNISNPSGSIQSASNIFTIGGRADVTTRQVGGNIYMAAHIAKAVNERIACNLSINPWQLFAPQTRRIWVPASYQQGFPQPMSLTAGNLSSTGADLTTTT